MAWPARYWHSLDDGRLQCDLCPRLCHLHPGQSGFCLIRRNDSGQLVSTAYGRTSGLAIDPVEKKPLHHFLPGSAVLSFGTAGCDLACKFCQNWHISATRHLDTLSVAAPPEAIVSAALTNGCVGVAYTYNDPVIFPEYAIDVAQLAHQRGLANIAVTAGSINAEPRADLFTHMDAANVDLKSLNNNFYRRVVGGHLEVVQDTLRFLASQPSLWLEVTTLVIPGFNDSDAELGGLAAWIAAELGPDVPWHVSAFHPAHRMLDVAPTSLATLRHARAIGLAEGLRFVYTGNIDDPEGSTTWCPACGKALIRRYGYRVTDIEISPKGHCQFCGQTIPGRWN